MNKIRFLVFLFIYNYGISQSKTYSLNAGWVFKEVSSTKWMHATVPGTVHTDLIKNNIIPDPFLKDNASKVQWVSKEDWEYKTEFYIPKINLKNKNIELVFEGLDTYAKVYLNNQLILEANNMFRTWRIKVDKIVTTNKNKLHIIFRSAENITDSLSQNSTIKRPSENNRNYVRKAQYQFGWDFAPRLITSGIWRNVKLEIGNISFKTSKITNSNIQLIQEKDSIGESFYFKVNGKPTFIKGANWVPADVFLPRITKNKYRNLLIAAKEAGINMLRVWGGGIYEDDYFYKLCDSLQIMVWQDFMFAGAMYPATKNDLENIKQEVIDNITRLNKFNCIALWCGNNEVDEAWKNWDWQKQFDISKTDSVFLWNEYKKIFQQLLPQLVSEFANCKNYISTSPKNGWGRKESMTSGDSHYWGVWWGLEPIETYTKKVPRFMSEYGMQSLPNIETIKTFAGNNVDTTSVNLKVHQKHPTGFENLANYLIQNKLYPKNFNEYILATQEVQSITLQTAISTHIQSQPICMGTMFWQFNDCWPAVSWSVIDFYDNKKKAFYTVKKLYNQ